MTHSLQHCVSNQLIKLTIFEKFIFLRFLSKYYIEEVYETILEKEAMRNFLKNVIKDPEWIVAFQKLSDQCIDLLPKYTKILQKHYNITAEECDNRYQSYAIRLTVIMSKVNIKILLESFDKISLTFF